MTQFHRNHLSYRQASSPGAAAHVWSGAIDALRRAWPPLALAVAAILCSSYAPAAIAAPPPQSPATAQIALALEFQQALVRAQRSEPGAAYQVGLSYPTGIGVAPNFRQAHHWLRRAANLGSVEAVVAQGQALEFGWGVAPDAEAARRHYNWAVEQRSPLGFFALARLYRQGARGVPQDVSEAYKLYALASAHGHYLGRREREATANVMSPLSREYALYRANAWERLQQGREAVGPLPFRMQAPRQRDKVQELRPGLFQLVDVYRVTNGP